MKWLYKNRYKAFINRAMKEFVKFDKNAKMVSKKTGTLAIYNSESIKYRDKISRAKDYTKSNFANINSLGIDMEKLEQLIYHFNEWIIPLVSLDSAIKNSVPCVVDQDFWLHANLAIDDFIKYVKLDNRIK